MRGKVVRSGGGDGARHAPVDVPDTVDLGLHSIVHATSVEIIKVSLLYAVAYPEICSGGCPEHRKVEDMEKPQN
ncbi:hypothetical protein J6590_061584 [Homalodisca vitripennis]|nr:hypothetical protein J6590_061584 [Homalodisca vitripennis]